MMVGVDIDQLESGTDAVLDGDAGALIVDPDPGLRADYDRRLTEQTEAREAASAFSGPVLTANGEPVRLMINVTGLAELRDMDSSKVDGIGLMRTEFLFREHE